MSRAKDVKANYILRRPFIFLASLLALLFFFSVFHFSTCNKTIDRQEKKSVQIASQNITWIQIPGGSFQMGSNDPGDESFESPPHTVNLPCFQMSKTETTVNQYHTCVKAGFCEKLEIGPFCNWGKVDRGAHPANCVNWYQADVFCKWIGGRLPTEAEWEYAAKGGENRDYPWGKRRANCNLAVMDENGYGCKKDRTWAVCSKPHGNSKHGLCDMAGNVWEWISDWFAEDYYSHSPQTSPKGPLEGAIKVVRGGSWRFGDSYSLRTARRSGLSPDHCGYGVVGFRCVRDSETE